MYGKDSLSYHLHEFKNLSTDPTPDTYEAMTNYLCCYSYKAQRGIIMCPMHSVLQTPLPLTPASLKKEDIGFPYPIPINWGSYFDNCGKSSFWFVSSHYSEHSCCHHLPH